jgi:hypothetical protein
VLGGNQAQLSNSANAWANHSVNITAHAGQTVQLRWHFDSVDGVANNFRGWQVDNVRISATGLVCKGGPILGDLDGNGVVDVYDLLIMLGAWGPCDGQGACTADLNGDGEVDVIDLLILLGNWS